MCNLKKLLLIFSIIFYCKSSNATLLKYLSIETLIKESYSIIIGEVVNKYSELNSTLSKIVTIVQIRIEQSYGNNRLKGEVKILTLGGSLGDISLKIPGEANYNIGERVLVFLEKKNGYFLTMGMAQGKFSLIKDEESNEDIAVRDLTGIPLLFPTQNSIKYKGIEKFTLSYLKKKIKEIFEEKK